MIAGVGSRMDGVEASVYRPYNGRVIWMREETPDITTFRVAFEDHEAVDAFTSFKPGNFVLASVIGYGEAPFAISSTPSQIGSIEISVRRLGVLTQALHELGVGDRVGVRGPYGNDFLLREPRGKNLLFVAGGIGMAPIRSLVQNVLEDRKSYGKITILYGARTVADIPYKEEFKRWDRMAGVDVVLTVDPGGETADWDGRIGYVPNTLSELSTSPTNCLAFVCGPQIVIKLSAQTLSNWGFEDSDIISTLENRMKCGIGKCGRCNIGHIYVCKHGPVFTYEEIREMPASDY
jgi:sulfhydrogenase subunit gamma (sulfur reductase)